MEFVFKKRQVFFFMEMSTTELLEKVSENYVISGSLSGYSKYVNGHINDTYRVDFHEESGESTSYVFQKINNYVFKEPQKVMSNIREINRYMDAIPNPPKCRIISYFDTKDGGNFVRTEDGFWRVCPFIKNSVSYETAEDPAILCSAGTAFGQFQSALSGFPMDRLYETIPGFHDTRSRLQDFFDKVSQDPLGRVKDLKEEIRFFEQTRKDAVKLGDLLEKGELPLRVTHNDTKYNNILMDKTTCEPLCIIDLDTVMPGLAMHDYGDAVRFAANTAAEDETDLSRVGLSQVNFEAFTKGFIGGAKELLGEKEINSMVDGAISITIELASRFLGDHIDGDRYFRIHHENHNLDRARCQIRMAEDMISKYDSMCNLVRRYYQ